MDVDNIFALTRANQISLGNESRLIRVMKSYDEIIIASGFGKLASHTIIRLIDHLIKVGRRVLQSKTRDSMKWHITLANRGIEYLASKIINEHYRNHTVTHYNSKFDVVVDFYNYNEILIKISYSDDMKGD